MSRLPQAQTKPILLFNDECAVCRLIGHWVQRSAQNRSGEISLIVRPIGDDPDALLALHSDLDIWDAYETIHLLMPDGSMKLGGEAVAEVLRSLPNTKWFAGWFSVSIFGFQPFQMVLNVSYTILADVRPLFGCESCGTAGWLRSIASITKWAKGIFGEKRHPSPSPHFTSLAGRGARPLQVAAERPPQARHI
ncbi:MAG TPA: DCC1-like thiol-disulfide oxidoreductase family protein [Candidatus Aquilonibacter sp.]|jgi:predicted DCC family thiol-disulfide oxidoreductase YuxK|nr:DCC1-like thiol-disulfide oxidoreductase family protein [Candidatus Aquilonibacter sp.]